MAEGKRKVNLHGTVKEKSEYKDYRLYPNSWQSRLGTLIFFAGLFFFTGFFFPSDSEMARAISPFFDFIGIPGMVVICLLLSYALFRQVIKRRR